MDMLKALENEKEELTIKYNEKMVIFYINF